MMAYAQRVRCNTFNFLNVWDRSEEEKTFSLTLIGPHDEGSRRQQDTRHGKQGTKTETL
jgi:hypothetical protein